MYIERVNYNKVITIKLVIPCGCNAKCSFCYNKDKNTLYDKTQFLNNFIQSLDHIIKEIGNKNPISLDITGGEPTLEPNLLIEILKKLKVYNIKSKVLRTTLTTNGYKLSEVIPYLKDVIDYVNISIHSFDSSERASIMRTDLVDNYNTLVKQLKDIGIDTSASAVIFKHISDFNVWKDEFIKWCKEIGFKALRFRCDVFWDNANQFDNYLLDAKSDSQFDVITYEKTADSHWLRLREKESGFRVFFLHGVLDTSLLTKGIEYVIDNDGKCYCDFYKRTPIKKYNYEIGKIYDYIED